MSWTNNILWDSDLRQALKDCPISTEPLLPILPICSIIPPLHVTRAQIQRAFGCHLVIACVWIYVSSNCDQYRNLGLHPQCIVAVVVSVKYIPQHVCGDLYRFGLTLRRDKMTTIWQTDILNLVSFWKSLCFDSNVTEISSNGPSDNTLGLNQIMACGLFGSFTDTFVNGLV